MSSPVIDVETDALHGLTILDAGRRRPVNPIWQRTITSGCTAARSPSPAGA
jgi:hypothetical protein